MIDKKLFLSKILLLSGLGLLMILPSACIIKHPPKYDLPAALEADVAEIVPDSLAIEVVEFEWHYYNDKAMIKISGMVRNNTGQAQQAITLKSTAFDEKGEFIVSGDSFLDPTYLPDGAEAKFEFRGLVKPGMQDIKHVKLITRATMLR